MNKIKKSIGIIVLIVLVGGGILLKMRTEIAVGNKEQKSIEKVEDMEKAEKTKISKEIETVKKVEESVAETETAAEEDKSRELTSVRGLVGTYQKYDRQLTLSDFAWIGIDTKMKKVVEKLGEPNGIAGSGLIRYYYELSDGSIIFLYENGYPENANSKIWEISLVSKNGGDNSYGFKLIEGKTNYTLGQEDRNFQKYDRNLQLASLENLIVGMNFNEIEAIWGKPNSHLESDNLKPYYELADGSFMIFENVNVPESKEVNVSAVKIIDKKNREFKLHDKSQINVTENE